MNTELKILIALSVLFLGATKFSTITEHFATNPPRAIVVQETTRNDMYSIPGKYRQTIPSRDIKGAVNFGYNTKARMPAEEHQGTTPEPAPGSEDHKIPIVYKRLMYANKKSRLNQLGDPIRGDLPITPLKGNWFAPACRPSIDLKSSALAYIGGPNNESSKKTEALKKEYSAGTHVSGMLANNVRLRGMGQDVHIGRFP